MPDTVPVPRGRARIEQQLSGLRVEMPTETLNGQLFTCLFGTAIWLIGDTVIVLSAFTDVDGPTDGDAGPGLYAFLALWLLVWNSFGALSFAGLIWRLAGRDVVEIANGDVAVERRAGPFRRRRVYAGSAVTNWRAGPVENQSWFWQGLPSLKAYGMGVGRIRFDYGDSTVRLGEVSEPEAVRLAELLSARAQP